VRSGGEKPVSDPRFYGRRKGKGLKPGQRAVVETVLPALRIALPEGEGRLDPAALFPRPVRAVWLEIGFGGGEHLANQAARNPDVGFIGAEPFLNGIGKLLVRVRDRGLANVRVWDDDVRPLLARLPDGCLERVFLLFPDPWPKARHARRRFVNPENLDELARLVVDGGVVRVASDDVTYQRWALRHAPVHPAFRWTARGPQDWRTRWPDAVATRYEDKAVRAGRRPMYLTFTRVPREGAA